MSYILECHCKIQFLLQARKEECQKMMNMIVHLIIYQWQLIGLIVWLNKVLFKDIWSRSLCNFGGTRPWTNFGNDCLHIFLWIIKCISVRFSVAQFLGAKISYWSWCRGICVSFLGKLWICVIWLLCFLLTMTH